MLQTAPRLREKVRKHGNRDGPLSDFGGWSGARTGSALPTRSILSNFIDRRDSGRALDP